MNTDKPSNPAGSGRKDEALKPDLRNDSAKKTPAADMQPDDTGSEASAGGTDSTKAESVMKQEHKTDAERRK
jgi:hypothetical protein